MAITPIETQYAGHRFRSRLEARWAVFFDHLGIAWEYEPQGYAIGPDERPYLPDFRLRGHDIWVEVKGSEDQLDVELIMMAAIPHFGLPGGWKPDGDHHVNLLILGPIQQAGPIADAKSDWTGFCNPCTPLSHSAREMSSSGAPTSPETATLSSSPATP